MTTIKGPNLGEEGAFDAVAREGVHCLRCGVHLPGASRGAGGLRRESGRVLSIVSRGVNYGVGLLVVAWSVAAVAGSAAAVSW